MKCQPVPPAALPQRCRAVRKRGHRPGSMHSVGHGTRRVRAASGVRGRGRERGGRAEMRDCPVLGWARVPSLGLWQLSKGKAAVLPVHAGAAQTPLHAPREQPAAGTGVRPAVLPTLSLRPCTPQLLGRTRQAAGCVPVGLHVLCRSGGAAVSCH